MITFIIDSLTHCLEDVKTGELYKTEVISIKSRKTLSRFNRHTGWYVNWNRFASSVEIYGLVLKSTMDIQGLIALQADYEANAVYINWASVSPENNIWAYGKKRFNGVGGHLFAIAARRSFELGFDGYLHGDAMNKDILMHYIKTYSAQSISFTGHPLHLIISGHDAKKIMEVYTYEWKSSNN